MADCLRVGLLSAVLVWPLASSAWAASELRVGPAAGTERGFGGVVRAGGPHVGLELGAGVVPLVAATSSGDVYWGFPVSTDVGLVWVGGEDMRRFHGGFATHVSYTSAMGPSVLMGYRAEVHLERMALAMTAGVGAYPWADAHLTDYFAPTDYARFEGNWPRFGVGLSAQYWLWRSAR